MLVAVEVIGITVFVTVPVIVAVAVEVLDGGATVAVIVGGTTVLVGAIVEVALPVGEGITVAVEVIAKVPRTT